MIKKAAGILAITGFIVSGVQAVTLQEAGSEGKWKIFKSTETPTQCFIVSSPQKSEAFRDGKTTTADRGDIRFYLQISGGKIEPTFKAGYALSSEYAAEAKIGNTSYKFSPNPAVDPGYAWPAASDDAALLASMKSGSEIKITAVSQRGTTTVDTFSLSGITAAYQKAAALCP